VARVAGIIVTLVPYHHARWEAFTRSSGAECHLVELTDQNAFKVLEFSTAASYQRHTLFPSHGGEILSPTAMRRTMAAKLDALRPDLVCVSGWGFPASFAALAWATRNRAPVVILSDSNEFDEPRSIVKETVKRRIVALCSAGLAGGTLQADYLAKLGLPRKHIWLGYDVVDNRYFAEKAAEVRSQRSEGPQARKDKREPRSVLPSLPFFLACSRFEPKKNLLRVIEAYSCYRLLSEKVESGRRKEEIWDLVIVGDGELRWEIESSISRLGVGNTVHLVGAKPYAEMPLYYGLASAFIHASTTEQWGLVVNEALASGLPVLVSNRCGCAPDLVRESVNGFTFDPFNIEQIAQLMLKTSAFNFPLSDFSAASARIIADWDLERFASGLKAAGDKAFQIGSKGISWLDRLLLHTLLSHYRCVLPAKGPT
jgi:1,2-diacylglycerol 3-alpha-glucosyltransferase